MSVDLEPIKAALEAREKARGCGMMYLIEADANLKRVTDVAALVTEIEELRAVIASRKCPECKEWLLNEAPEMLCVNPDCDWLPSGR
jgi:hypothetical protein